MSVLERSRIEVCDQRHGLRRKLPKTEQHLKKNLITKTAGKEERRKWKDIVAHGKSGFANGIPGDKIIKAALLLFGQFAELKTETSDLNHAERNGRLTP